MTNGKGPALPLTCHPPYPIWHTGLSSSQMAERSPRDEGCGGDTHRRPGKDARRRRPLFPLRQADRGWTGPGRGPVRAAGPGAARHQPLPALCRLDVPVVRPASPHPGAGAGGTKDRTTGRAVPSASPWTSPAPAVAEEATKADPRGRRDHLCVSHICDSDVCDLSSLEIIITDLLSCGWRFPILRGAQSGAGGAGDRRSTRGAA